MVASNWTKIRSHSNLKKTGLLGVAGGFFWGNPIPQTLTEHGLQATAGVLFQLQGNFFNIGYQEQLNYQSHTQKISSDREKP